MTDPNLPIKAAARLLMPGALWVVRYSLSSSQSGLATVLMPLLDVGLVALHWWAAQPVRAQDPNRFGRNDSLSKFLLVPMVVAALLLVRDTWIALGPNG